MPAARIGERVRVRREKLNLSQSELATKAQMSRTYLSLIERGEADNISFKVLSRLALALGTSPAEVTGETEDHLVMSPSLRQFALEDGLAFEDVVNLSRLALRGREPATPEEWRRLHQAITDALTDDG